MATERVTADQWADFVSDYRTTQNEVIREDGSSFMLSRLPNGRVIAMVRYRGDGTKRYSVRRCTAAKYPEFKINYGAEFRARNEG